MSLKVIPAPQSVALKSGTCQVPVSEARIKIRKSLPAEGYEIDLGPSGIKVRAGSEAGAFYARQTLLQMEAAYGAGLPCCSIKDAPRYGWRGLMLDESRHFFGMAYVKKLLDIMAYYKMNVFHWHLTDMQSWRLEIKSYPLLTEVGAEGDRDFADAWPHFYTQEDVAEIVRYASERFITVVPEIDVPGHFRAANRAYPEFSGGESKRYTHFTINVGSEKAYSYLESILGEVAEMFPGKYLHIGADEVSFGIQAWETNPDVQELIRREGLGDLKGAEAWFERRVAATVASLGKTTVAWDEARDSGMDRNAVLMMWHDTMRTLPQVLDAGYKAVLTPTYPLYFSFVQREGDTAGQNRHGRVNTQQMVYSFPDLCDGEETGVSGFGDSILGIQANLWTELVHNTTRADWMIHPRLCALAESGWTQREGKNYEDFTARMEDAYRYLDSRSVYYCDLRDPGAHPEPPILKKKKK